MLHNNPDMNLPEWNLDERVTKFSAYQSRTTKFGGEIVDWNGKDNDEEYKTSFVNSNDLIRWKKLMVIENTNGQSCINITRYKIINLFISDPAINTNKSNESLNSWKQIGNHYDFSQIFDDPSLDDHPVYINLKFGKYTDPI